MTNASEYKTEVTYHLGSNRAFRHESIYSTLQEAVERIESEASGHTMLRAWINNKQVKVRNGKVLGEDNEPLCTNPAWHELFASPSEAIPAIPAKPFKPDLHVRAPRPETIARELAAEMGDL